MSQAKKQNVVSVKLLVDNHTHAGEACEKGDVIHLLKTQADTLIEANKAEAAKGETVEKNQ